VRSDVVDLRLAEGLISAYICMGCCILSFESDLEPCERFDCTPNGRVAEVSSSTLGRWFVACWNRCSSLGTCLWFSMLTVLRCKSAKLTF